MSTRAAPPLGGFLELHRATEFVIDASTLEILNVLRIGYPAHYSGGGFCASGAVCSALLHVRSHNIRSEGSSPQVETLRPGQLLRIPLPRTPVNKGTRKG